MKLGEIIKNFREEKKLSMDRFAEKSGLTKGYISMLEKNEHPKSKKPIIPTEETLLKVAKGMGVDIDFVLSKLDSDQEIQINISPKNMLNMDNPSTPTTP
ncbi:TPA: helix-turn-helix domain-containing protein, partial [Streptococcus pyogenes]|nr:helix-turn-helix transcriptional regulator [Streptococcus pyogenes]HEP1704689.1 helix-turn-helix transcriptional regulator [Streptococcus pyogenes]HEP1910938.1 helix-turn-helix transcriptional regulator [Streptococcus pyogenes]HEP2020126.1 helix-turn-helix transcriptional regulator [Streptococcus pyogenes]HEP2145122.1 helix-turn-helix transcriptional regulator [Streptococcus pyogenes]